MEQSKAGIQPDTFNMLAGNRYLESVLIPKSPLWHMLAIILSVVVASLFMAGALLVWQFPRLHREFATWQLQRLKAR